MTAIRVLAGDLGGTKTLLVIADCEGARITVQHRQRFASGDYDDLAPMVHSFLQDSGAARPERACFGVAGPVDDDGTHQRSRLTNLPWQLDSSKLGDTLEIPHLRLINDFQAVGYGIEALGDGDLHTLQAGRHRPRGIRAALGAGTGLGQTLAVWQGERYEAFPTEGGHADFAPADDLQVELLQHLRGELGHVSFERILSGSGLARIYRFLQKRARAEAPRELNEAFESGDPAPLISDMALAGSDPIASAALDLFVSIYGAQAGNLALTALARGGVYLAGGIAPQILPRLRDGRFMDAFRNKGRMTELAESIPVHVILNRDVGLLGAALAASHL
ncbi:MAG TPA: glucokinase [Gammaproteobacteria bacterium]|nr:glucokinase [Gammaproteobacteria bacterium]